MPTLLLCIKAELENVASLGLAPGASFCVDVQEGGGSEVRKGVHINPAEDVELSTGKATANFVMKFDKGSKKEAYVNVVELKGVTRAYTADDGDKFVPVAAFECRGLDLIGYHPEASFVVAAANSSSRWQDVDLSEGEWTEYDEKAGESVGVYDVKSEFRLHKG